MCPDKLLDPGENAVPARNNPALRQWLLLVVLLIMLRVAYMEAAATGVRDVMVSVIPWGRLTTIEVGAYAITEPELASLRPLLRAVVVYPRQVITSSDSLPLLQHRGRRLLQRSRVCERRLGAGTAPAAAASFW